MAHLDKIEIMSEKLQNRLQDMLMMSELDMLTTDDLELRTVDLAQLLRQLIDMSQPMRRGKVSAARRRLSCLRSASLQADELYLALALTKVVHNAIHYTDNGGTIHLAIARLERQVAISVRDTGVGIAESDLPHIFERFYRAKSYRPLRLRFGIGIEPRAAHHRAPQWANRSRQCR